MDCLEHLDFDIRTGPGPGPNVCFILDAVTSVGETLGLWGGGSDDGGKQQAREERADAEEQYIRDSLTTERNEALNRPFWELSREDPNAYLLGRPEMAGARADRGSIESQRRALHSLEMLGKGEIQQGDLAAQRLLQRGTAQEARAGREALEQQMQARGMAGSGTELAQQLANQQTQANSLSAQDLGLQAAVQQRALGALQSQGGLASNIRGQSFGESAARRSALDAANQYNLDHQRNVQQRNVAGSNVYNEGRWANRENAHNRYYSGQQGQRQNTVDQMRGQASAYQQQAANAKAQQAGFYQDTIKELVKSGAKAGGAPA